MLKTLALFFALLLAITVTSVRADYAPATQPSTQPAPRFKVLALYSLKAETAHVAFAKDAIAFYTKLAAANNFSFEASTDWSLLNADNLKNYSLIIWLDDQPHNAAQQKAFQDYMENGGAWLGHHVAGFNLKGDRWPWFHDFFGGAYFYTNNWPPVPAKLIVDSTNTPITKDIPASYNSPANEFYQWEPSPRLNKDVVVLATLDPSNYPLGKKDLLTNGDIPVIWSNTKYKMLYINMGHGTKILDDTTQNQLFAQAVLWLGDKSQPKLAPNPEPKK